MYAQIYKDMQMPMNLSSLSSYAHICVYFFFFAIVFFPLLFS